MVVRELLWDGQAGATTPSLRGLSSVGRAATSVGRWLRASPLTCGLIVGFTVTWLAERALIGQRHGHLILGYLAFGALPDATVLGRGNPGQWWRYIASGAVHNRVPVHIVVVAAAMLLVGAWVERAYGRLAMLAALILAVAAGSLTWIAAAAFDPTPEANYTVGCSAGVCGLVGIMLVHGYRRPGGTTRAAAHAIKLRAALGITLMVLLGLLVPQLNNFAHAGGLACGILCGQVLPLRGDAELRPRISLGRLALLGVVLAGGVAMLLAANNLAIRLTAS